MQFLPYNLCYDHFYTQLNILNELKITKISQKLTNSSHFINKNRPINNIESWKSSREDYSRKPI